MNAGLVLVPVICCLLVPIGAAIFGLVHVWRSKQKEEPIGTISTRRRGWYSFLPGWKRP